MVDVVLSPKVMHSSAVELYSIICDDGVRNSKTADNVLPNELHHLFPGDGLVGLGFNPFCEVVCGNEEVSEIGRCL